MSESFEAKGYKKKKKKSYLSRAKKFGKSGRFGRGSYVSEDVYNYFVRVVEINNGKFETEEERGKILFIVCMYHIYFALQ
jgi:nucleolar protein 9